MEVHSLPPTRLSRSSLALISIIVPLARHLNLFLLHNSISHFHSNPSADVVKPSRFHAHNLSWNKKWNRNFENVLVLQLWVFFCFIISVTRAIITALALLFDVHLESAGEAKNAFKGVEGIIKWHKVCKHFTTDSRFEKIKTLRMKYSTLATAFLSN